MAKTHSSADAGSDLRRIVRINEEIKSVVATAFKVNLMAMNAIFLAKRAGQSALGFGVLSNELRRFAQDLQQQMTGLREATYGNVAMVTQMLKQSRISRLLERTRIETTGEAGELVRSLVTRRAERVVAGNDRQLAALNRRLSYMIEDTAQLVELGGVLARSAKIEAAYGGTFSASLMQVSSDFEKTIGEIRRSLDRLTRSQPEDFSP